MSNTGLVHIYCGDGKGKTTAAIGLAIRAAGAGLKVCFAQFMKSGNSSEWEVMQNIENIHAVSVKNPYGFTWKMSDQEKEELAKKNSEQLKLLIKEIENYDLLILDEIMSAYNHDLLEKELVYKMLGQREKTEIVMTGRDPDQKLLKQADYITQMQCVRHPYEKGIAARKGIEY